VELGRPEPFQLSVPEHRLTAEPTKAGLVHRLAPLDVQRVAATVGPQRVLPAADVEEEDPQTVGRLGESPAGGSVEPADDGNDPAVGETLRGGYGLLR